MTKKLITNTKLNKLSSLIMAIAIYIAANAFPQPGAIAGDITMIPADFSSLTQTSNPSIINTSTIKKDNRVLTNIIASKSVCSKIKGTAFRDMKTRTFSDMIAKRNAKQMLITNDVDDEIGVKLVELTPELLKKTTSTVPVLGY